MREMMFRTPSTTLRDVHKDVWRVAHSPADRGDGNRSFLFRRYPDGVVLVRGPNLPARHSVAAAPLIEGKEYSFDVLVHPVKRIDGGKRGERLIPVDGLAEWLASRMQGFAILDWKAAASSFVMEGDVKLQGYEITGRLRVTDVDTAKNTASRGVGRAKGFGFGLLVLA